MTTSLPGVTGGPKSGGAAYFSAPQNLPAEISPETDAVSFDEVIEQAASNPPATDRPTAQPAQPESQLSVPELQLAATILLGSPGVVLSELSVALEVDVEADSKAPAEPNPPVADDAQRAALYVAGLTVWTPPPPPLPAPAIPAPPTTTAGGSSQPSERVVLPDRDQRGPISELSPEPNGSLEPAPLPPRESAVQPSGSEVPRPKVALKPIEDFVGAGRMEPPFGTTGAKHAHWMKNAAETIRTDRPSGKILLDQAEHIALIESVRGAEVARPSTDQKVNDPSESAPLAVAGTVALPSSAGVLEAERPILPDAVRPAPTSLAAEVELRIRSRVLEFKRLDTDSMSVVLRPDANTEIHLRLCLSGDGVDVAAHVARGDATALQTHWGQMQESLSGQGIRLAALGETAPLPPGGSSFSDGFHRTARQPEHQEEQFETSRPSHTPPPPRQPSPRRAARYNHPLLESWA